MNHISMEDLTIPVCVEQYRKRNVLASMVKKKNEHPLPEYIEFLEDIADVLYKDYIPPKESEEDKKQYEELITKAILDRDSYRESKIKCEHHFSMICRAAISLNDFIYAKSDVIESQLSSWCICHDSHMFSSEYHAHAMYHVYFFVPILIEHISTENEVIRNILKDYEINSQRIKFTPSDICSSWWSEYATHRPDSFVTPEIIAGRELSIEYQDIKQKSKDIERLLSFLGEKGLCKIVTSYLFASEITEHPLDTMVEKLRFDYYNMIMNNKKVEIFV